MQRQRLIRHEQVRVNAHQRAQARAGGAGAVRVVKGKHARRHLFHADAAVGAGVVLRKHHLLPVDDVDHDEPARHAHRRLQRVRQALAHVRLDHQAVHHRLDGVLLVLFQLDLLVQPIEHAVHARADVAVALEVLEHLDVLALSAADDGGEHLDARALGQREDLIHHLIHALLLDLPAALGAMRDADARIEQAQVVVHLRHRAHGGAGVLAGGLLVDGDGGRQTVDVVHVGLFHLPQKHARIGGQRLDVPALPLGI